jgi:shikimate dehydrogenase
MGWPVAHSLSPRLHGYWLERYGIDGAYVPLAVEPGHVAEALTALPRFGFEGCNVTVPHKRAALELVDIAEPLAQRIGAVNTVVCGPDGRLTGFNSDAFGFLENLRADHPGWRADSGPAAVLGAGGAARAVCAALIDEGASEVRLLNRTRATAEALAREIGGNIVIGDWSDRAAALDGAALLVNTTSLGMVGQPALEIDLAALPDTTLVTDIVYNPLVTTLLANAAARGNPIVDGIGMLLHQARPGFAAWFGTEPAVDDGLKDFVLAGLGD